MGEGGSEGRRGRERECVRERGERERERGGVRRSVLEKEREIKREEKEGGRGEGETDIKIKES